MDERIARGRARQIELYGGLEGYRAEMRRRRSLVKKPFNFSAMSKEQVLKAQQNSAKQRVKNNEAKRRAQTEDTAQEDY